MYSIEFDGSSPAVPWKVTADTGESWHALSEIEALAQLTAFVVARQMRARFSAEGPEPEPQLPPEAVMV